MLTVQAIHRSCSSIVSRKDESDLTSPLIDARTDFCFEIKYKLAGSLAHIGVVTESPEATLLSDSVVTSEWVVGRVTVSGGEEASYFVVQAVSVVKGDSVAIDYISVSDSACP